MSYKLFLDDVRTPDQVKWVRLPAGPYVVVRSYQEFVNKIMQQGVPEFVSFDHDLADEHYAIGSRHVDSLIDNNIFNHDYGVEKTGFDCARWLVDYCIEQGCKFPNYAIHSMNPVGVERISMYISQAQKFVSSL